MKISSHRFTVHDRNRNTTSGLWNCHVRGSDIYLFARSIGYALKASLHTQTGECHIKYTPPFMEKNVGVLADRYIDKWIYTKVGAYVVPLTVVMPPAAVNRPHQESAKAVQMIAASEANEAVFVRLVITAPGIPIKGRPLLVRPLPNGEHLVIAVHYGATPKIKGLENRPVKFFKGVSSDALVESRNLRMLLLTGDGQSRTLVEFVTAEF